VVLLSDSMEKKPCLPWGIWDHRTGKGVSFSPCSVELVPKEFNRRMRLAVETMLVCCFAIVLPKYFLCLVWKKVDLSC
jgi:hypothetical protein